MALSTEIVAELRKTAESLRAELAAVEGLLAFYGYQPALSPKVEPAGTSPSAVFSTPQTDGPDQSPGLRSAIYAILDSSRKRWLPKDVTAELIKGGWPVSGSGVKTPLSVRVGGELGRLAREKRIQRSKGKYFRIAGEPTPALQLEDLL